MTSTISYKSQISKLHTILVELKSARHIFSFAVSNSKCPQNDNNKDKRKSPLFIVVGVLTILSGLRLLLDKQLNGYAIYFIILVGMGVIVLLGGIYGVCFLYNIKLKRT